MEKDATIQAIRNYVEVKILAQHKINALGSNSQLKSYKINPIVVRYLSKVLDDGFTAEGIAKALYFPRVLGTSINTSFGTAIQKMFVELGLAKGSLIKGMDVEFIDQLDGRTKYCQLKAGPNTINSEDVSPLLRKFDKVLNLARTNSMSVNNNDLILGVLYGSQDQLSQHYLRINERHPVIVGTEFWHRLTGIDNFYDSLVHELDDLIFGMPTDDLLEDGWRKLAAEIEQSDQFNLNNHD